MEINKAGSYTFDVSEIIKKAVEAWDPEGCPYSIVLVAEDDATVSISSGDSEASGAKLVMSNCRVDAMRMEMAGREE